MARVHILLATYNGEKYLCEQIDSILNQTYRDWALYISDDGSRDDTLTIIERYISENPDRIFRLEAGERLGGATKNFSFLFSACPQAEFYMFCDQDDVWLETKIEHMVDVMEEKPAAEPALVYCDLAVVDQDLRHVADSFFSYQGLDKHKKDKKTILYKNYIPGCVMMYNDALRRIVTNIPREAVVHDWWLALVATHFGRVEFTNQRGNLYRQHDANGVGAEQAVGTGTEVKRVFRGAVSHPFSRVKTIVDRMDHNLCEAVIQSRAFYRRYGRRMEGRDEKYTKRFFTMRDNRGRLGHAIFFARNYRGIGLGPVRYTASILALLRKK